MFVDLPIPPIYKKTLKFTTLTKTFTSTINTLNYFTGSQPKFHATLKFICCRFVNSDNRWFSLVDLNGRYGYWKAFCYRMLRSDGEVVLQKVQKTDGKILLHRACVYINSLLTKGGPKCKMFMWFRCSGFGHITNMVEIIFSTTCAHKMRKRPCQLNWWLDLGSNFYMGLIYMILTLHASITNSCKLLKRSLEGKKKHKWFHRDCCDAQDEGIDGFTIVVLRTSLFVIFWDDRVDRLNGLGDLVIDEDFKEEEENVDTDVA